MARSPRSACDGWLVVTWVAATETDLNRLISRSGPNTNHSNPKPVAARPGPPLERTAMPPKDHNNRVFTFRSPSVLSSRSQSDDPGGSSSSSSSYEKFTHHNHRNHRPSSRFLRPASAVPCKARSRMCRNEPGPASRFFELTDGCCWRVSPKPQSNCEM